MKFTRKNDSAIKTQKDFSSGEDTEKADNSLSLSEQVYLLLKEDIIASVLPPGDSIIETAIARKFGVSRTPVREALRRLMQDGLVKIVHGSRYVITPITVRSVYEVFSLRMLLEGEAAALATPQIPLSVLDELESLVINLTTLNLTDLNSDGRLEYVNANRQFHSGIAHASGHDRLIRQILQLLDEADRLVYSETRLVRQMGAEESQRIIEAMRARDAELARQRMHEHIQATYLRAKEIIMTGEAIGINVVL